MHVRYPAFILCLCLAASAGFASPARAQSIEYGKANQQEMLQRSKELNSRAKTDTRSAADRMRRVLKEKREGKRGFDNDFMNMQATYGDSSGNSNGR